MIENLVLSTDNLDEWNSYIDILPDVNKDIFIQPEYFKLFENKFSKAECFVFKDGKYFLIYPYLKNNITKILNQNSKEIYFDIEGVYGYNGIYPLLESHTLIDNFSSCFQQYCNDNNIISEFIRFNPLFNKNLKPNYLEIKKTNTNVILNLQNDWDFIFNNEFDYSIRKNYKKSLAKNLSIEIVDYNNISNEYLKSFIEIYFSTLKRRNADKFYYFDKIFFLNLSKHLNSNYTFFFVKYNNEYIATELILKNNYYSYSYLGGTNSNYFDLSPNDYLKVEIIKYLKKNNFKFFCLGGGSKNDDGIFKFKKKYSKNVIDFYIGTKVHNLEKYNYFTNMWLTQNPTISSKYLNYFQKYKI